MSARTMAWGWQIVFSGILQNRTSAKLVLLRICDRADSDGICWPGHGKTAKELRFSKTTVKESIKLFEELNLLHKKHRRSEEGDSASNLYILHLDFIPPHDDAGGVCQPAPHLETEQGGGSASAPPRSASAPGVGHSAPQGGAQVDPEPKREPVTGSSSTRERERVPAPASAGDAADAAANRPEATAKANKNKAFRIVDGVSCWGDDDAEMARMLTELHGAAAVQAAAKHLQSQGVASVPSRVAQELRRAAAAARAAEAAARAEARAAAIEAASRRRSEQELAELMALEGIQKRQERDP